MGQSGIDFVMEKARQPALRQALKVQRLEYQTIGAKAKKLAKEKDMTIRNSSSMVRSMANLSARGKLMMGNADSQIAGMMIQGSTRGMIQSLKQMHKTQKPDRQVAELSQALLETQINNIRQMEGFL